MPRARFNTSSNSSICSGRPQINARTTELAARSTRSTLAMLSKILQLPSKTKGVIQIIINSIFLPFLFLLFYRRNVYCALSTTSASCRQTAFTHWPIVTTPFQTECSMQRLQAATTGPHGCSQLQRPGTVAFRFQRRTMTRPVRTRTSASQRCDEHARGLCKTGTKLRTMHLAPLLYLPLRLRDSTPNHPKCSRSTWGTTLFTAGTFPSLDYD